jgi:hypothetical protein
MTTEEWIKERVQKGILKDTARNLATLFTLLDRGTEYESNNHYFGLTGKNPKSIIQYLKLMNKQIFK